MGLKNKRDRVREAAGRRIFKLYISKKLTDDFFFCLHLKGSTKYRSGPGCPEVRPGYRQQGQSHSV